MNSLRSTWTSVAFADEDESDDGWADGSEAVEEDPEELDVAAGGWDVVALSFLSSPQAASSTRAAATAAIR